MSGIIPGSAPGGLVVKDEASTVVALATSINLIGTSVVATQDGSNPNQANITVSGGGGGGSSNSYFPSGW